MKHNQILQRCISRLSPQSVEHSRLAFDVADRIACVLSQKGMTKSDLAKGMGKSEDEVAGWLGGSQSLTLKTIASIQAFLGEKLIVVP